MKIGANPQLTLELNATASAVSLKHLPYFSCLNFSCLISVEGILLMKTSKSPFKKSPFNLSLSKVALWGLIPMMAIAAVSAPVMAQRANFGVIHISSSSQTQSEARGYTQGSVPLASMARHDSQGNMCVGFAESEPDHILRIDQDLGSIDLRVDSNGGDTTLLIQAANGITWCGDDEGHSTDAHVQLTNLRAGDYQIWVGSFDPGVRYQYRLHIN
jgi:hypothetical protein